jgi:hypothetical protein
MLTDNRHREQPKFDTSMIGKIAKRGKARDAVEISN